MPTERESLMSQVGRASPDQAIPHMALSIDSLVASLDELKRVVEDGVVGSRNATDRTLVCESRLAIVEQNVAQLLKLVRDGNGGKSLMARMQDLEGAVARGLKARRVLYRRLEKTEAVLQRDMSMHVMSRSRLTVAIVAGITTVLSAVVALGAAWSKAVK